MSEALFNEGLYDIYIVYKGTAETHAHTIELSSTDYICPTHNSQSPSTSSLGPLLLLNLVNYHYDLPIAPPTASVSFNNPHLFGSNNAHYRTMRLRLASLIILLPAILAAPLLRRQYNSWNGMAAVFGDLTNNGAAALGTLLEPVLGAGEHSSILDRLG
jgi:hypothetical protein